MLSPSIFSINVPSATNSKVIFDGGNTGPKVGPTLLTSLWCPEVETLAALCPQVSRLHLRVRGGVNVVGVQDDT